MPARSTVAQPDEALKDQIKELKQKVSELDNANGQLRKELGAAQKDAAKASELVAEVRRQDAAYKAAQSEIDRLKAEVNSARSAGSRDAEIIAAAKALANAVKKLA